MSVNRMNIYKALYFIRYWCLSYQLPKNKKKFDKIKGEVLEYFESLDDADKILLEQAPENIKKEVTEAIQFLKDSKEYRNVYNNYKSTVNDNTKEVIRLINKLLKYMLMWGDIEEIGEKGIKYDIPSEYLSVYGGSIKYIAKKIKEKYFPMPDPKKPLIWKQYFGVDFADGESIMVCFTVTKDPDGSITISPVIVEPEKGGEK